MSHVQHIPTERWVLAFDASCGTCSAVSATVAEASDDKFEVLPLSHPRVQEWRRRCPGPEPDWKPTLLRVRGEDVRAWTGPALSLALARRLGVRSTVRVLQALGALREQVTRGQGRVPGSASPVSRKRFLHLVGGAVAAVGLSTAGQTPAFATASEPAKAAAWVRANMGTLPRTYAEIVRHPVTYRRAIFQVLTPEERSRAWLDHFAAYRRARPKLSAAQQQVMAGLTELTPRVFDEPGRHGAELDALAERARRAFGLAEAAALLARLGPDDGLELRRPDCNCNMSDAYCYRCGPVNCNASSWGCGTLYTKPCNGVCM
ncbi:bacteriocin fulvocin C-related protein [Streptomyces sp. NPDC013455]|uniref:bacteriocin fulvocin C-related protein n=1 Tax=Streptomyces sp. NPDC013455 TaxID=3155605 RepID=UPI0033C4472D